MSHKRLFSSHILPYTEHNRSNDAKNEQEQRRRRNPRKHDASPYECNHEKSQTDDKEECAAEIELVKRVLYPVSGATESKG